MERGSIEKNQFGSSGGQMLDMGATANNLTQIPLMTASSGHKQQEIPEIQFVLSQFQQKPRDESLEMID